MAVLTKTTSSLTGGEPTFNACNSEGDSFANTGKTLLHFKNEDVSPTTVTVNSVQLCNFGFDHDVEITVPAGEELLVGPFSTSRFGSTAGMTYSSITDLSVAVYEPA